MKNGRVCIVCSLILLLVGCKNQKINKNEISNFSPLLDTDREVSINIIGTYGNFEALEEVFNDFNKIYPKVKMTYEYSDNIRSTTLNRCVAKDNIDIIFFHSLGFDSTYKEISEKYMVDLSRTYMNFSPIDSNILQATKLNGKQTFLPVYLHTTGLLVNKNLLKKYNLDVPKNLSEFETVCDTFVKNGIKPLYTSYSLQGSFFYNHIIYQIEKSKNKNEILTNMLESKIDPEILLDSAVLYNRWKEKGYFDFSGNELSNAYNDLIMRFLDGDIPFAIGTSDNISGVKKREKKSEKYKASPFDYTFIATPTGENGYECVFEPSILFGVCNTSHNLEYALEFMRFLITVPELNKMTIIKGMPSVYQHTGDSRITCFENLKEEEKFYIGQDEFPRKVANTIYYSLLKTNSDKLKLDEFSSAYNKILESY